MLFGCVTDFADGIHRNECLGIGTADEIHELFVLLLVHDDDDLPPGRIIVCANSLVKGRSAVKLVKHKKNRDIIK